MSAYSDLVASLNPLGYWRFGEASGTSLLDSSGNGRHGSYIGTPTFGVPGLIEGDPDTAVGLSSGSYGQVTYDAAWMNQSTAAYGVWFKTTLGGIVNLMTRRYDYLSLDLHNSNSARVYAVINGTLRVLTVNNLPELRDGNRHFIVGRYNGTTLDLFADGVKIGSAAYSGTLSPYAGGIMFGRRGDVVSGYGEFVGTMDDAVMLPGSITGADVTALWNGGTTAPAAGGAVVVEALVPVIRLSGAVAPPPVTGALALTTPVPALALSGSYTPETVAGTLDLTTPIPAVALAGGVQGAAITGAMALASPVPTLALAGVHTPPAITGAVALVAPPPVMALAGSIAGAAIQGALTLTTPVPALALRGGSATPTTDTFNRTNGRTRSGTGWANLDEPVAPVPATLTREPIRVMAQTLPTPTLEKGRPV